MQPEFPSHQNRSIKVELTMELGIEDDTMAHGWTKLFAQYKWYKRHKIKIEILV
jgi:hypothetical protein